MVFQPSMVFIIPIILIMVTYTTFEEISEDKELLVK